MSLIETVKSWFTPHQPLSKEIVHYQTPPDAEDQYRLHLRIEPDGRGLLVINAATVLHLNQTAAEYARLLIQGASEEEAAQVIAKRYRVSKAQAQGDYARLRDHAGLDPQAPVVVLGSLDRVELWEPGRYATETGAGSDEFAPRDTPTD